ncbi:MAG TPA: hypothetical protein VKE93_16295 [Candidatus Angelobacter sp.]|nr:hypothetical protein [Candidatus Angelobacter sp.]
MKNVTLLAPLLLVAAAWSQTADIQGIKIKDSGFDGRTRTVSLTFINDRAADITAYDYCFTVFSTDSKQTREQCSLIDALTSVLEMRAARKARPLLPEITLLGPGHNVVHPGEERRIEEYIGYNGTIVSGSIHIDAVAWSDSTVEGSAQSIIAARTAELQERRFVSRTIKNALSDGQEPALTSVIAALQQEQQEAGKDGCLACQEKRTHVLMQAIYALQQPNRHMGDTREFVPDNQREFLEQLLARHDSLSEEHAKHVSLRKVDQQ